MQIPYPVLGGSQCTCQGSTREAVSWRYGCPAEARALCDGTKHTPGPRVREAKEAPGEGGAMAHPVEASCPQSESFDQEQCV